MKFSVEHARRATRRAVRPVMLLRLTLAVAGLAAWICSTAAGASVVVVSNRTAGEVGFAILHSGGHTTAYRLAREAVIPIPVAGEVVLELAAGDVPRRWTLEADSIYCFITRGEKLDLTAVELPGGSEETAVRARRSEKNPPAAERTISVKLLTDDDEPAVQRIWETRLRQRLAKASKIFQEQFHVRFKVVAVDTWKSDNGIEDFQETLREFERTVDPAPARLAIGFTSQYQTPTGTSHLDATRRPLGTHLLLPEWSPDLSRAERLEVLVHELGHYLGAAHSGEIDSVMRPDLGGGRSRDRRFRIGFDPINTLILYLVGEQLRTGADSFDALSPDTKTRLRGAYKALGNIMPNDPVAPRLLRLLDVSDDLSPVPRGHVSEDASDDAARKAAVGAAAPPASLADATRVVVRAITAAARENRRAGLGTRAAEPLAGDRLTEHYVRRAASAASKLPDHLDADALLAGLGIALGDSAALRKVPLVGSFYRRVESDQDRAARRAVLGTPTIRGRRDLAQHFFSCCELTVLIGPHGAESAGILKEVADAQSGGGFSFVDLSADLAGILFATHIRNGNVPLARVARSFTIGSFQPEIGGLQEPVAWKDFVRTYGGTEDARFRRTLATLRRQILALPGYRD